jgi:murein DD-endopeptidase MepM/ murein hydrolase activator NlpD
MNQSENHEDKDFVMSDDDKTEDARVGYEYEGEDIPDAADRKPSMIPSIVSAAGFLVLIIFGIAILSRTQDLAEYDQVKALESRLQQLENRLAGAQDAGAQTPVALNPQKEFDLLTARLDRLEVEFNSKMNRVIKALESRKELPIPQAAPNAKAPQPEKKEPKAAEPKTHTVRAGETLYRIGQRYGLTVDQLRDFNNLGPNAKIYPGQELRLTP